MNLLLKTAGAACMAAAMIALTAPAHAALIFIDGAGNPASAPSVIDATNEAIYFSETALPGGGQYTVTNNTVSYGLTAFGISNTDTQAWIEFVLNTFGCESSWCYGSSNLDSSNWDSTEIDFYGNTGSDVFGDISNVLDPSDNTLNFYLEGDGALQSGQSWDGFIFSEGIPSSQLFIVLDGPGGPIYASGGTPIPEPGAALLVLSGLIGLSFHRRRS